MKHKRIVSFLVVGAMALAGTLGAFVYHNVSAQAPTPTPTVQNGTTTSPQSGATAPQSGTTTTQPGAGKGIRGDFQGTDRDQKLADALGITLEKLQAAETAANSEALKQAVAKGLLTQAQADQMAANPHPGRGFGFERGAASGIDTNAILASQLGISADQLTAAQQKVQDDELAAAVTSGALTQAQADLIKARQALESNTKFQDSLKSAFSSAVAQAVTDGVITQAQADAILANQAGPGFPGMGGHGMGGFEGGRGGHRGGPGGVNGKSNGSTSPAPTTPSTTN